MFSRFFNKLYEALGFGYAEYPDFSDQNVDDKIFPIFVVSKTVVNLKWKDRIRVLFSGKIMLQVGTKSARDPGHGVKVASTFSVLPPGDHEDI